jgi:hypothetical protein
MKTAEEWTTALEIHAAECVHHSPCVSTVELVRAIQADALRWAADMMPLRYKGVPSPAHEDIKMIADAIERGKS